MGGGCDGGGRGGKGDGRCGGCKAGDGRSVGGKAGDGCSGNDVGDVGARRDDAAVGVCCVAL